MKKNKEILGFIDNLPVDYLRVQLQDNPQRVKDLSLQACGIRVDFSKQLWDLEIINKLINDINIDGAIEDKIQALFNGEKINVSEDRSVKHYLLRATKGSYQDEDETLAINERERFLSFAHSIFLNPKIKNIVNIGIGGSDLGPKMVSHALTGAVKKLYFVSNIDERELRDVLSFVEIEETIFVVVSKTFTTVETLRNAQRAKEEFLKEFSLNEMKNHFIAVTTNSDAAKSFGMSEERIFGFWEWVGGRYSLASAVGISLAMTYGRTIFEDLIQGMGDFDQYFKKTPLIENLAFWHALSWYFNLNYLNCKNVAVIGYASSLEYFATYLQQLIMESNGKSVNLNGEPIKSPASPIVFGEVGTNSQHSFFQMIHQGSDLIPVDFIAIKPRANSKEDVSLLANALAQASVLALGSEPTKNISAQRRMSGNRPSNLILLNTLDAYTLGALISLYEASTIIQGFINNINSFDQWGVQLGKTVALALEESIYSANLKDLDSSTRSAIEYLN